MQRHLTRLNCSLIPLSGLFNHDLGMIQAHDFACTESENQLLNGIAWTKPNFKHMVMGLNPQQV
jgi:hypothetical protein